jgi:ferredoxin
VSVLRVNWVACQGRGLCHEVAPELVDLDPWGYPILRDLDGSATPGEELRELAREASATCPLQALRVSSGPSR